MFAFMLADELFIAFYVSSVSLKELLNWYNLFEISTQVHYLSQLQTLAIRKLLLISKLFVHVSLKQIFIRIVNSSIFERLLTGLQVE